MKKILTVMALAIVLVWGFGVKGASATYMDPVSFYVVDDDTGSNDDSVTLSFAVNNSQGGTLQYSTDNVSWITVTGGTTGPIAASNWQQVWMRIDNGSGSYDTDGEVTFLGEETNSGLYNSVNVIWDTIKLPNFSVDVDIYNYVANDDDNVAPVPIPAAAWLLGSGLFGLVGVRRRMKKSEEEV